ncbi:glycosyltransferase family 4 protein (plasmid) [Deinococcus sp. KNUC1210]|uniref:glycosyltransferase family 4 protein n=1 Tax=Deinococcus sp. KNUC1210 TaxID=2917691 RepID=UPI001EEFBBA1|nr:glycosyltransferase family 4 protein [Deinococcus sp. KNUC1210]ULH17210.1 glycosyltransferase family 4 protein [Deinococcus sp. KNUC1210]
MRVAMLAPIAWRVPPRHYGPWERVVSLLTEELVRTGLDVTLFATADSLTTAALRATAPGGYEETPGLDVKVEEVLHLANLFDQADAFDIIHNHADFLPLSYAGLVETPTVTTIHGFSGPRILPVYRRYDGQTSYVSISDADRCPELTYLATIYHGLDLSELRFDPLGGEALVYFGRMHPDKGAADAIRIAQSAGRPLLMAGIIQDAGYFEREVQPHLSDQIRYLGSVGPQERERLLGGARALLHPVHFDEPFGLSMAEAMACGTPVIAYRRGSVPEVVGQDGGFIVEEGDEAAAVQAVHAAARFDRHAARARVERLFTVERMARAYVDVYRRMQVR